MGMPLGYLRRPLFLCLVLYICVLAFLHYRGFFHIVAPAELASGRPWDGIVIQGRVVSPLKEDFRGQKMFLSAQTLCGRPFAPKLLAYLPRGTDWSGLRPGMPVELSGRLRRPRSPRNPGEFDERSFLEDRGASGIINAESLRILGPVPWPWRLKAWAEGARRSLEGFFQRALPADEARVFSGLTLGFKGPLRRDWNRAVQDAGAMHLLVPSGAKVAFVMLGAALLAAWLGLCPAWRLVLVELCGGFYTLMVGADAPYTRAFWGGTALGICQLAGRDSGAFQAMTLAAILTLLWDPRELFGAGFQMTYAAVLGLVVAMPGFKNLTPGLPRQLRGLICVALVSVIVQVMLWPTFANTFGRGSLVGVLANILLVPASGILMTAGFGAWGAGSWHEAATPILGRALGWLARLFVQVCRLFAALPGAARDLSPMSPTAIAVYYLLAFSLLVLPRWRAALALAAAGLLLWAGAAAAGRLTAPAVRVLFLRLPPAHPALICFADGRRWLVDPGGKASAVSRALRSRGIARLDRLVLTGPWPQKARDRLLRSLSWREALRVAAPWRLCEKDICFEFGGPRGPRVLRGEVQFGIIPRRLKLGAVEVLTDGRRAGIRFPCQPPRPDRSVPWSPSAMRPSRRPAA